MLVFKLLLIWLSIYTLENMIRTEYDNFSIFNKKVESIVMFIEVVILCGVATMSMNMQSRITIPIWLLSLLGGIFFGSIFYYISAMGSAFLLNILKIIIMLFTSCIGYNVSYSKSDNINTWRIILLVLNIVGFIAYMVVFIKSQFF